MRISIDQTTVNSILDAEEPDYWHARGVCYQTREQITALTTGGACPQCGYKLGTLPPYTRDAILAAAKRAANAAAKRAAARARMEQQDDLPF